PESGRAPGGSSAPRPRGAVPRTPPPAGSPPHVSGHPSLRCCRLSSCDPSMGKRSLHALRELPRRLMPAAVPAAAEKIERACQVRSPILRCSCSGSNIFLARLLPEGPVFLVPRLRVGSFRHEDQEVGKVRRPRIGPESIGPEKGQIRRGRKGGQHLG